MIEPTLLTYPARPVNGGHLKYALRKSGEWFYEPKYNGWRAILHVPTGAMWNRHGKRLSIASEFAQAVSMLKRIRFEWLDVEALSRRHNLGRGTLIVLDSPNPNPNPNLQERRTMLLQELGEERVLHPEFKIADNAVYLAPSYPESQRDWAWNHLQVANEWFRCEFYEGLVAKRADSPYPIQLSSPDHTIGTWMKHRFIK